MAEGTTPVLLGESVFSLQHFLNALAEGGKPLISRQTAEHFLYFVLHRHPLQYFGKIQNRFFLAPLFLQAIRWLKQYEITPPLLEEILQQSGSLREYDLLTVYQAYENLKEEGNLFDSEDQYSQAIENIRNGTDGLEGVESLTFENFSEKPAALRTLLETLRQKRPEITVQFNNLEDPDSAALGNASLFSLPSPSQEIDWFLESFLLHEENPAKTAILVGSHPDYYEPIWQHLRRLGLTIGESPFLKWSERQEGRSLMEQAGNLPCEKNISLGRWLESLFSSTLPDPLIDLLEKVRFSESLHPLGNLSKKERSYWLRSLLNRFPRQTLPDQLEGIQWLRTEEEDYPRVDCLWVPGLYQDQFGMQAASRFFQERRDRSLPEWEKLTKAFPESKETYKKTKLRFLHLIGRTQSGAWLTLPRADASGKDLSPSPLTWEIENITYLGDSPPPVFRHTLISQEEKQLSRKLKIERERLQHNLESRTYHAFLDKTSPPIPVQEPEYTFSATQLETYAQCPFKYFARRVLSIPQQKEFAPEVDPEDRGTLFHAVLEKLLIQHTELFLKAREKPEAEQQLYNNLKLLVEEVFSDLKEKIGYANDTLYRHLQENIFRQGKEILHGELEASRTLHVPLKPKYFEWGFGGGDEKEGLVLNDAKYGKPIRLRGFVDRIDWDPDTKRFLVLDYKTGTTSALKEKLEKGLSIQLPLYILAVQTLLLKNFRFVGGMLVSVRSGERKHGLVDKSYNGEHFKLHNRSHTLVEHEALCRAIEKAKEHVEYFVGEIRAGRFAPEPLECKSSCDYKEICRYADKPMD